MAHSYIVTFLIQNIKAIAVSILFKTIQSSAADPKTGQIRNFSSYPIPDRGTRYLQITDPK